MYSDGPIRTYLEHAASGRPTPGGGSVSALVGALGAAMACMAANFTVGRRKFRDVEPRCAAILARCEASWRALLDLTDADTQAYAQVSAAYGSAKGTPEQQTARTQAIQQALRAAMDVPLRALRVCETIARDLEELADIANPNLLSDVGVAAIHALAGLRGCKLNVEVNLASIDDTEFVACHRREIDAAEARAGAVCEKVLAKVAATIWKT